MDLQQWFLLFVGAVILMVICPALMVVATITLDSIKPRLGFDLCKAVSPGIDLIFMPAILGSRVFDALISGFKDKSEKEQEDYWKDAYTKAGY